MQICIAGKNKCSIEFVNFISKKIQKKRILILPNQNDTGKDNWQPSLKKFAKKNKFKITNLKSLYKIKDLIFISIEYETIIKPHLFSSKKLFNFHFSLLPKYRGCHTNFLQIYKGEKNSGVTLHRIEKGIDTGKIISKIPFKININHSSYENYLRLLKYAKIIFEKNIYKVLKGDFKENKQNLKKGNYFSRRSINYKKLIFLNNFKHNIKTHNRIRSLIFPPFQLPIYKGRKIKKSIFRNKKIKLIYK